MSRGKHTKHEYWQQHFNEQAASGLTTADYLRREGIRSSQWYYWHKKLRNANDSSSITLVPIELDPRASLAQQVTVDLPNGLAITFPQVALPEQLIQSLCHLEL